MTVSSQAVATLVKTYMPVTTTYCITPTNPNQPSLKVEKLTTAIETQRESSADGSLSELALEQIVEAAGCSRAEVIGWGVPA